MKMAASKNKASFKCKKCGKTFTLLASLHMHHRRHSGLKLFKCEVCGKPFYSTGDLNRHLKSHAGVKDFQCGFCGLQYSRKTSLRCHIERVHNGSSDNFSKVPCKDCGKMVPPECEYNHDCVSVFSKEGQIFCEHCHALFDSVVKLKEHLTKEHREMSQFISYEETVKLPYKSVKVPCKDCGKMIHRDSVKRHSRVHSGEKPYLCLRCLTTYCDPSSIRQHMRCHVKDGQLFCRNCQSIFNSEDELKDHVTQKHEGQNLYQLYESEEVERMITERNKNGGVTISQKGKKIKRSSKQKPLITKLENASSSVSVKEEPSEDMELSALLPQDFNDIDIKHEELDLNYSDSLFL